MDTNRVVTGDAFDVLADLPSESVHAVVTDPPYGLNFMGKDWDNFRRKHNEADSGRENVFGRTSSTSPAHGAETEGKRYQQWCEEWATLTLDVLKPGGHLLAFSGNRTHHRLFSGVEDAGFEIRDTLTWHYGSGFPKALDVSKAIDKDNDLEGGRGAPKSERHAGWIDNGRMRGDDGQDGWQRPWMDDSDKVEKNARKYLPEHPDAKRFKGWKTHLKPATEFVVLARKPLPGTVAECVQAHGTGALNIGKTRISTNDNSQDRASIRSRDGGCTDAGSIDHTNRTSNARVLRRILRTSLLECGVSPQNLPDPNVPEYAPNLSEVADSLNGCPAYHRLCDGLLRRLLEDDQAPRSLRNDVLECIRPCEHWDDLASEGEHIPDSLCTLLPVQEPVLETLSALVGLNDEYATHDIESDGLPKRESGGGFGDSEQDYGQNADSWDGTTPKREGRYPANVIFDAKAAAALDRSEEHVEGGRAGNGYEWKGSHSMRDGMSGGASEYDDYGGPSRYFYTSKATRAERTLDGTIANAHPTVKPQDLMEWLVKLVTAEGQVVLDPFCGSGTTLKAAKDLNREFIGIEQDPKWADVARVRAGLTPRDPAHVRDEDDDQQGLEAYTDGGEE